MWNRLCRLCYDSAMTDATTKVPVPHSGQPVGAAACNVSSWAVPSKQDDEVWEALTRDQQLAALQSHFASDECTTVSLRTVSEIVARARASGGS